MTSRAAAKEKASPPGERHFGRVRPPSARSFVINVTVRDVMSRHPVVIGPDATLLDSLVLMTGQRVSGVPVVDDVGNLVGVLSQRDVARALKDAGGLPEVTGPLDLVMLTLPDQRGLDARALRRILEDTHVSDAMSTPPISISPDASLELAAEMMRENEINRIPVLHEDRLVGIITRNDLVRAFVHS